MPNRFEAEKTNRLAAVGRTARRASQTERRIAAFAELLFERAAGEDIVEYEPAALAAIARDAFAFFRHRAEPTAVRVADIADADRAGRFHTAIELSTANRPFIFDSVLGELQALGHPVRLVVHPILDVRRDAAGEAMEFRGRRRSRRAAGSAKASSTCTCR